MKAPVKQDRNSPVQVRGRSLAVYVAAELAPSVDGAGIAAPALREAMEDDYAFAERLYVETMAPLFRALEAWDHESATNRLRAAFHLPEVWIIRIDDRDAGWLQISEEAEWLELHQLHLVQAVRCRGIGTFLLRCLMQKAQVEGKRISLAVLPNNQARYLYERLGFTYSGTEGVKLLMAWPGPASAGQGDSKQMHTQ